VAVRLMVPLPFGTAMLPRDLGSARLTLTALRAPVSRSNTLSLFPFQYSQSLDALLEVQASQYAVVQLKVEFRVLPNKL